MARRRRVYGTPWSKLAGNVPLSRDVLNRLGKCLVDSIVTEAKKDFAKQGSRPTPRGEPQGLPDSKDFFNSFRYRIVGQRTIEIWSDWPWIDQIIEGRDPYRMSWLVGEKNVKRVPVVQSGGRVLMRSVPFKTADAWIHPGFARHTFFERGVRKGRKKMAEIVFAECLRQLAAGDPLR